jgi:hypothetical protein
LENASKGQLPVLVAQQRKRTGLPHEIAHPASSDVACATVRNWTRISG